MIEVHELPGKLPGSIKYIVNGYSYHRDKRDMSVLDLRCATRTSQYSRCKGKIVINLEKTEILDEAEQTVCFENNDLARKEFFIQECVRRAPLSTKDCFEIFNTIARK